MKALLLIDIQNDFLPGGMVEVPDGDQVIPIALQIIDLFDCVLFIRDWHPANHCSFAANHLWRKPGQNLEWKGVDQLLWPMHCIQDSFGAELAFTLPQEKIHHQVFKGTDPDFDSYSGFFDNARKNPTDLASFLHEKGIKDLYLMGLPLEFGVRYTALDAVALGFRTWIVEEGCKALNAQPRDEELVWKELRDSGVSLISSSKIAPISG